jgi:GDPmannose 4,6-dehydratase
MKKALITGITGQDGSYLVEFLLKRGYEIYGLTRKDDFFNTDKFDKQHKVQLMHGNLIDTNSINDIINTVKPDEVYNLGAQSRIEVSFEKPEYTGNVVALGTLRILEAIRKLGLKTKFYQASSSEMFGNANPPQNENTIFQPRNPYAISKLYAYWITKNYREAYDIFACNGILFSHESPRRGETFVTRKITKAIANIKAGRQKKLYLGNLDAKRDWGYAGDYVEIMWRMLQQKEPDDYVISTGEVHTVKEFVQEAFSYAGLDWKKYVEIDPKLVRPTESNCLIGDSDKAKEKLGWEPKVRFKELVKIMVDADMEALDNEK